MPAIIQALFPELVLIQPHAQKAFDLLVSHVESNTALPRRASVPRRRLICI